MQLFHFRSRDVHPVKLSRWLRRAFGRGVSFTVPCTTCHYNVIRTFTLSFAAVEVNCANKRRSSVGADLAELM